MPRRMNYDPSAFAEDIVKLQERARYMPVVYAVCGLLVGVSIAELFGPHRNGLDELVPPLALTGVVVGFFIGRARALAARLQAQCYFRQLAGK